MISIPAQPKTINLKPASIAGVVSLLSEKAGSWPNLPA